MPREQSPLTSALMSRPLRPAAGEPGTGFVASGARIPLSQTVKRRLKKMPWQEEAWRWFDEIAEYRYACEWVGNLLSRAVLVLLEDGKPTTTQLAMDIMASFFGGKDGQAEMLRMLGIHFTAVGEAWIVGIPAEEVEGEGIEDEDEWIVAASTKTQATARGWKVDGTLYTSPLAIRLWRPHPERRSESDSPSRPLLTTLLEIDNLSKHINAQTESRLIGNGMLLVPSEISFGTKPGTGESNTGLTSVSADEFLASFIETASEALTDRGSASARVPGVLQASGEHLQHIKHLTFWSELDEKAIELRKEAIRRFALGMDMPPEIIEGTADMNHWGSWQVEEASIKAHTEPLLGIITRSIFKFIVAPLLEDAGIDTSKFSLIADTTEMRLRPNRSKEAVELYDRGELSGVALRRENGFHEEDAMTDSERALWHLRKVASGQTNPEVVEAALRALKVDLGPVITSPSSARISEARPTPSLAEHPTHELPESAQAALVMAAEPHVFRALERAGNRIRTNYGIKPAGKVRDCYKLAQLTPSQMDAVLVDAWTSVEDLTYQPTTDFKARLDRYTRSIMASGADHDPDVLLEYLTATK